MSDFGVTFGIVLATNALVITLFYAVVSYWRGESILQIAATLFWSIPIVLLRSYRVWVAVALVAFSIFMLNTLAPVSLSDLSVLLAPPDCGA